MRPLVSVVQRFYTINSYLCDKIPQNMSSNANLTAKLVGEITGEFVVKSYQRGYRWEKFQVSALLNDIYDNGNNPYCLQPVVVRKLEENTYELIDGQQRLTTLLILLKYIQHEYKPRVAIQYTLSYETREKTAEFLDNITAEGAESNIDFFYIHKAYHTIDSWFKTLAEKSPNKDLEAADDMFGYLNKNVKVIWYEVNEDVDSIAMFARLNIGKIALTNAELVKAMFLMNVGESGRNHQKQIEMSIQWDEIEHSLRENADEFWYFLTRTNPAKYPTRIELLFDFMADKQPGERETFFTFFYFEGLIREQGIEGVWRQIQYAYLQLKEWYSVSLYYHKIGYLIASETVIMPEILSLAKGRRKQDFMTEIDGKIAESIRIPAEKSYKDLSYNKDYQMISRILLLFNVQSIIVSESTQRFPFSKFNTSEWSLEHIHAQQSESLRTTENRIDWLKNHIEYVRKSSKEFEKETLCAKMQEAIDKNIITQAEFDQLAADAFVALSENDDTRYVDLINNMALLSREINSKLNNSVFAVKRDAIIELDKKGAFIPYCTKMVFLKYYTSSTSTQFEFWSAADRDAYMNAMEEILTPYLSIIETLF